MKFFIKNKIAITAISLLATGAFGYAGVTYYQNNRSPEDSPTQQQETAKKSTASTQQTGEGDDKQATINQSQQENQGAAAPKAPDFNLTLTRSGQPGAGQNVEIRALVSGVSSGTCTANFSGPGRAFSKTSSITFDGRTTSCGALDAAASEFSASGTWTFTLRASSGSKTSNQIEEKVTVQK